MAASLFCKNISVKIYVNFCKRNNPQIISLNLSLYIVRKSKISVLNQFYNLPLKKLSIRAHLPRNLHSRHLTTRAGNRFTTTRRDSHRIPIVCQALYQTARVYRQRDDTCFRLSLDIPIPLSALFTFVCTKLRALIRYGDFSSATRGDITREQGKLSV